MWRAWCLLVVLQALMRWLPEERLPPSERRIHCDFHGQR